MFISVITVCYNEKKNIRKTMMSVLNQNTDKYEYIICDGGSNDGTVDVINELIEQNKGKKINVVLKSEKDGGIYYGMNNGIRLAKGTHCLFINAGDMLFDENVLKDVINSDVEDGVVAYGDCIFLEKEVQKKVIGDDTKLLTTMSVSHPAVFIPLSSMKKRPYDTSLKIAADYEYLVYLKMNNFEFQHIDRVISLFSFGGVCTTQYQNSIMERCAIWEKYGIPYDIKKETRLAKREEMISNFKNRMPKNIWLFYNKIIRKRTIGGG